MVTLVISCAVTAFIFFVLGWTLSPTKIVDTQQLSQYLDKVVNQEEAEVRRNQIRRMLHDSGRRTMRLDGGSPAKIHKMRRKRRMYRDPTA